MKIYTKNFVDIICFTVRINFDTLPQNNINGKETGNTMKPD